MKAPKTLLDVILFYSDEQVAFEAMRDWIWPGGVQCPHCLCTKVKYMQIEKARGEKVTVRRLWNCNGCRKQFTAKTGTIFEDSSISFTKWLPALWLICNAKNGVSSCEVARSLGVTQKTAWFMLHRIRTAMQAGSFEKLTGEVEVDETLVGGRPFNMHKGKRERMESRSRKTVVFGMLQRGGHVKAYAVPDVKLSTLAPPILRNVELGSALFSDENNTYRSLKGNYAHAFVNHSETFADGPIHTNGLENFWSLLKRTIGGTYTHVAPVHLDQYLSEQTFRYNLREITDGGRFLVLATQVVGKRLTYKQLTCKA